MNQLVCPISSEQINENVSRATAGIIFILIGIFMLTQNIWLLVFVLFDFSFRIFEKQSFNPISCFVRRIYKLTRLPDKMINKAPKVFAARLGFFLSALSFALYFFFPTATVVIVGILGICVFADAVFNFCIGCVIYHYLVYPFYKNKQKNNF